MTAAWAHTAGGPAPVLAWNLRFEIVLPIVLASALYILGWRRLSRRAEPRPSAARLTAALGGLAAIAVALVSPLDRLADRLFVAHMIQHMLLIMVAAPALLLADPLPIVLWGLPRTARLAAGRRLTRRSAAGRLVIAMTPITLTWVAYALVLWLWHVPVAYDAALADRTLHDVEHVMFFAAALLFWWPVIHPAPRFRRPVSHAVRVVYVALAAFHTAALGLLLSLAPVVLYRSYATAAHAPSLSAIDDQMWGGVVMWGAGGLIDMLAVLVLVYRSLGAAGGTRDAPADRMHHANGSARGAHPLTRGDERSESFRN